MVFKKSITFEVDPFTNMEIIEVKTKKHLSDFIHLPATIHKNHKNWVPPLYMDDREFFDSKKNILFEKADTILLLAYEGSKPIGRIMGIINHKYNKEHNENDARFCFIETYEDFNVANALLEKIEEWAKAKQKDNLIGPLGFSDKDPQGLMIEGYDEPLVIATNGNLPYMVDFVEQAGFSQKRDLVVYKTEIPEQMPVIYHKIRERALKNNPGLHFAKITNKKELKKYVRPVLTLMNETFKNIYASTPFTEKEMDEFADRYIMILDLKFLKVLLNGNDELVAFVLAMPDISKGIQKCKGYVLPIGILQILFYQKRSKQLNLLLGGVKEKYRNAGYDTLLGIELLTEARNAGMTVMDSHLILADNVKMRAEMEKLGGKVFKKYRIYQKNLH
jgi:hypothetical protein